MGGAPTISGGMSQAEYQKLLDEQRKYAEEADLKREERLKQYEQDRIKAEKDLLEAQKLAEQAKITSQQDAEAEIAAEIEATQSEDQSTMSNLGRSFYDSLYKGLSPNAERPD
jgi:hypothetical protein